MLLEARRRRPYMGSLRVWEGIGLLGTTVEVMNWTTDHGIISSQT
jgi:hypothetical protein